MNAGDIDMITVCTMLKQVLNKIRAILEAGELEQLPACLADRMMLMDKLRKARPDKSLLEETIQLLKEITREEKLLMQLAEEKKDGLQEEIMAFQARRKAARNYHDRSLYGAGVQP